MLEWLSFHQKLGAIGKGSDNIPITIILKQGKNDRTLTEKGIYNKDNLSKIKISELLIKKNYHIF